MNRRSFLSSAAMASLAINLAAQERKAIGEKPEKTEKEKEEPPAGAPKRPVLVSKYTGKLEAAYDLLRRTGDTLEAVLFVCKAQEDDPNDTTVGLGGLPNEEGVVELDACVMHGPTRRAGAVASVRDIRNVSLLARLVMERTDHLLLVGEGAKRFALAHGFKEENLLTEHARKVWILWKEAMSNQDNWGPGLSDPAWKPPVATPQAWEQRLHKLERRAEELGILPELRQKAIEQALRPPTGTIHCSAVNERGEMSGATSTSGLAWKLPGRVGDSPLIGAGCWTDQDVGSAGATGRGEENIKICGAHTIVENMRRGMSPQEAALDALRRIARNYNNDMTRLRFMDMVFYALRKDGAYAGVSLWSHAASGRPITFAVHDGNFRVENCVALFQGHSTTWPPQPQVAKPS